MQITDAKPFAMCVGLYYLARAVWGYVSIIINCENRAYPGMSSQFVNERENGPAQRRTPTNTFLSQLIFFDDACTKINGATDSSHVATSFKFDRFPIPWRWWESDKEPSTQYITLCQLFWREMHFFKIPQYHFAQFIWIKYFSWINQQQLIFYCY